MSNCEITFVELNEAGVDREAIENIALYTSRIKKAVHRQKITGKYADPNKKLGSFDDMLAKKLEEKYKGLVGKTIDVYSGNRAESVKVTELVGIDRNTVRINDTRYNARTGESLDGTKEVNVLGSEVNHGVEGYSVSESLYLNTIDDLLDLADKLYNEDFDAGKIDEGHSTYLYDIMYEYEKALQKVTSENPVTAEIMTKLVTNDDDYMFGSANPEIGKMRLMMGSRKYSSGLEIMAHELQHILIENTLKVNPDVKYEVRKLREVMARNLDSKIFLRQIENPTSEDIKRADELFEYAFHNKNNPESEFLAFATTNSDVIAAIGNIKMTGELLGYADGNGRIVKIYNRIARIINKVYSDIKYGKGSNGHEVAFKLLKSALDISAKNRKEEDAGVLGTVNTWLTKADKKVRSFTEKIDEETGTLADDIRNGLNDKSRMQVVMDKLWKIRFLDKARSFALQNNLFNSLTRNSDNEDIGKFYDMFRQSKMLIDRTVQTIKSVTYDTLLKTYDLNKMDKGLRRAAKRVLIDTDARSIGTLDDVVRVIESEDEWNKEMAKAEAGLKPETIRAAQALGVTIVDNVSNIHNGFDNASQIARVVEKITVKEVVDKIDKVASLMALKSLNTADKELAVKAIRENAKGLQAAVNMYYAHQDDLVEVAYAGNKGLVSKASKQEHYVDRKKYYLVGEDEMKELTRKTKMNNLGKHDELSRLIGNDMYIVVGDAIESQYTEGLMSMVQLKNEGDSLLRILRENGYSDEDAIGKIRAEAKSDNKKYGKYLVPDRDYNGDIRDYRFRIDQDIKEKYLGLENDIVHTVSHTVANLTHKDEAILSNRSAIKHLVNFYDKYKDDTSMKFIKIDKNSTGKEKEYWDIMPGYLKKELKRLSGNDYLMVEQSMLVDFFGYRDASLADAFKNKRWQLAARKLESVLREITQIWKKDIVTKRGGTIFGNLSSNMLVTLQHTENKDPLVYAKDFERVWEYINQYQKDSRELQRLAVLKAAGETIKEGRIESLKSAMKDNPVDVLMKDGQYSTILEDISTGLADEKGLIGKTIEKMFEQIKNKNRRTTVKSVMNELYLDNESKAYQKLIKLTQYGDIINRVIVHEDNMKYGKMTERESLRYVDGLFVNYAYLDNKYIKYANDLGFVVFTKFFFRTMPALLKMAAKKPVTMFLTESSKGLTGVKLEHPIDQIYHPVDTMGRKLMLWDEPLNVLDTIGMPSILHLV